MPPTAETTPFARLPFSIPVSVVDPVPPNPTVHVEVPVTEPLEEYSPCVPLIYGSERSVEAMKDVDEATPEGAIRKIDEVAPFDDVVATSRKAPLVVGDGAR